jgi:hypothetical protein
MLFECKKLEKLKFPPLPLVLLFIDDVFDVDDDDDCIIAKLEARLAKDAEDELLEWFILVEFVEIDGVKE